MAEQVCRDPMWLADILTQEDTVTRATTPTTDTVDASLAADDDGHEYANKLFASKDGLTPAKCMAYTELYDTNQAVARIMKIYNMDRAWYYEQAVKDNDINRARLKHKQTHVNALIAAGTVDDQSSELAGDA